MPREWHRVQHVRDIVPDQEEGRKHDAQCVALLPRGDLGEHDRVRDVIAPPANECHAHAKEDDHVQRPREDQRAAKVSGLLHARGQLHREEGRDVRPGSRRGTQQRLGGPHCPVFARVAEGQRRHLGAVVVQARRRKLYHSDGQDAEQREERKNRGVGKCPQLCRQQADHRDREDVVVAATLVRGDLDKTLQGLGAQEQRHR
mmetsp:Transcript_50012/g.159977  ORF Transcript_50012/g.159977 Transcript_50012/m.159977 type:complete len:202 (+) Transcript_50012:519-1124(+)